MARVRRHTSHNPVWRTDEILLGILQQLASTALIVSAFVLVVSTNQSRAAGSALLLGLLISALTRANQIRFRTAVEYLVAVAGACAVLAPWMLGFAAHDFATWAHLTLGILSVGCAMVWLKFEREP
ncbi:MAG: SPW repeat protein [Methylobacterium sp.]|nr:SPW repeat protein [Methylobacterium sp.]